MKTGQRASLLFLGGIYALALTADLWTAPYDRQFRNQIDSAPSRVFPIGTDDLGRDRLARLAHGSRVSLLLAPAAALLATALGAVAGILAGFFGGWTRRFVMIAVDLALALPWFFLLLTVRAAMPLDTPPGLSLLVTFAMLGGLGWGLPARVVRVSTEQILAADYILAARGRGLCRARIMFRHVLPNLTPILLAQFWISVPVFILAESSLGFLGLGVTEPLPSWGGLLRELENYSRVLDQPWLLAPAALLVAVVFAFQRVLTREECVR